MGAATVMRDMGLARKVIQTLPTLDLESYLSSRTTAIDRALEAYLKRYGDCSGKLWKAMHYGLFPGGKRLRPILVLAAGELFGAKRKAMMPFACAVELIHGYSLIHDDLPALDNDDLRRGEPTNHKVFGEGMALLAGDGLLTAAFHVLSGAQVVSQVPAPLLLKLVHELSYAVGVDGLVGGQAFDLEAEKREVDIGTVEYIHVRKTGALIRTSIRLGAQVAGASPADLRRVTRFGNCLGLAFQIADDLLDILGETASGERAASGHSEWNKATYPSVVGIARAQQRLKELFDQCLHELTPFGKAAQPLRAITAQVTVRALEISRKSAAEETHI